MIDKTYSLPKVCAITAIAFVVMATLFQPGELDLVNPQHSDFFRYFMLSEVRWSSIDWLAPRPLMLAYLKVAGIFHRPDFLFVLLALPALCFIAGLAFFVPACGLGRGGIWPLLAFYFATFGSPYFYPIFQHDFGGMLSGFIAILAIGTGLKAIRENNGSSAYWWFLPLLFTLLSVESKPTYSFLLLILAFIGAVFMKGNRSKWLFVGVLLVLCWVFTKDKLLGSSFVASSDAASPYAVVLDPIRNIQVLAGYMKHAFTLPLAWTALLASIVLLALRDWKLLSLLAVLAISASMPMALLVNRSWDTYAWYSTVIIGVLMMVVVSRLMAAISESQNARRKVLAVSALLLMFSGLIAHAFSRNPDVEWILTNQHYNRNLLSALSLLNGAGERKVLLANVKGPYHPLRNTSFVERAFPKIGKFDVLLKKNEREWNELSPEQTNGVYPEDVKWADYSRIYFFDEEGFLTDKRTVDEFLGMPQYQKNLFLYCNQFGTHNFAFSTYIAKAIECLNREQKYDDSIALGQTATGSWEQQPWIVFHLAKSYQAIGDKPHASELLTRALKLDPNNPLFLSTLTQFQTNVQSGAANANQ